MSVLAGWLDAQDQWALQPLTMPTPWPSPREYAAMAMHELTGQLVLFGGRDSAQPIGQRCFGDTWLFDGNTWTQVQPQHAPAARFQHAMVADCNGDVLLLGGQDETSFLSDAWRWDGADWSPLPAPLGLGTFANGGMAMDPARRVVVAHAAPYMHEWDGASWRRVPSNLGSAVIEGNGVFDPVRGKLLFCCRDPNGASVRAWDGVQWASPLSSISSVYTTAGITWWDPHQERTQFLSARTTTGAWQLWVLWPNNRAESMSTMPSAGGLGVAPAYHSGSARMILFGGTNATGAVVNTTSQLLSTSAQPWSVTSFGNGCAGSSGIPEIALRRGYPPLVGGSGMFDPTVIVRLSHQAPNPWNLAYLGFGWSRTQWLSWSLPLSLGLMGAPDCTAWVAADVFANVRNFGDPSDFVYELPFLQQLVGSSTFVQAVVFDATAPNAIGLTTSSALEIVVGRR